MDEGKDDDMSQSTQPGIESPARTGRHAEKVTRDAAVAEVGVAPVESRPAVAQGGTQVEARNVNLYYGDFHAVADVTMTIEPNRVTALIGSSGCGKTTFLRALNRMHELTAGARATGEISLDGHDIYGSNIDPVTVRRLVGMVFQAPNPFPTMSIFENVAAGLTLNNRKMKKSEKEEVVERSLRGAHLWEEVKDRLDQPGSGLSGGQQQRLCIARTIAVEPEVILMDEPCSALDPVATLAVEDLIQELKQRFTVVIVTHNMQQASRASDYTAFFNLERSGDPGRLVEMDRTEKIFSNPEKKATEDYVSGRFG
jgi:phosphate transport system ATP-binding protein